MCGVQIKFLFFVGNIIRILKLRLTQAWLHLFCKAQGIFGLFKIIESYFFYYIKSL